MEGACFIYTMVYLDWNRGSVLYKTLYYMELDK